MADANPVADVGLIGLAVMGQNLVLNMADHNINVAVFNRTTATMQAWIDKINKEEPSASRVSGHSDLKEFLAAIKRPRKVLILVKAGPAIDAVVQQLIEAGIEKDDLVVDCGDPAGMASTVIDLTGDEPVLLRQGAGPWPV